MSETIKGGDISPSTSNVSLAATPTLRAVTMQRAVLASYASELHP